VIELVIDKRGHDLGGGFAVGRVLPFRVRRSVGPFEFFDHMGPVDLAHGIPRSLDVRPHPHIGLATVTYLFSGALTHRDSLGVNQEILPGAVNWMVAGRGITHSERFERARSEGAHMHGIQSWVALPAEDEEIAPAFHHVSGRELTAWEEPGVRGRLIAGEAEGMRAGVPVRSPTLYMHWIMNAGARRLLPAEHQERAVYVADGAVELAGQRLVAGQMAVLASGHGVSVLADSPAVVMALGGAPLGGAVHLVELRQLAP